MPTARTIFPWLLFTTSLAINIHLWRHHSPTPTHKSHTAYETYGRYPVSEAPTISAPSHPSHPSRDTRLPTGPSRETTIATTATHSSALRNYADILAEELQTPEQLAALHQLLARWVATSPADAATWLAQHDDAPFYDPAALHVARHLVAHEHFPEATSWAGLIRDQALREDALDAIVAESFRAKKIDATAVRASGLPSERIAAILNGSRLD